MFMSIGISGRRGVGIVVLSVVLAAPWAVAQDKPDDKAQQQRLEKLQVENAKAAFLLLPVIVTEKPNRMVADVLGLTLEQKGFENLTTTDAAFAPPAGTTWDKMPAALGEFVRKNPPATPYVVLAEFVGTPQTGPQEVRFLVVDKAGALVLTDRQTPADTDYKETAAADPDPMGCSVLVAQRMSKLLKVPAGVGPVKNGKFAQLWAQKSGTPSEAERNAMQKPQEEFKKALRGATLLIYPTRVNGEVKPDQARHLADALTKEFGCKARVADAPFKVEIAPTPNQQKRLWDLARGFRDFVKQTPPDAAYALIADYLIQPDGPAGGTHFVICDKAGQWVIVDFQNSVWEDFKKINPKSADDCDRLTALRLAGYVK